VAERVGFEPSLHHLMHPNYPVFSMGYGAYASALVWAVAVQGGIRECSGNQPTGLTSEWLVRHSFSSIWQEQREMFRAL